MGFAHPLKPLPFRRGLYSPSPILNKRGVLGRAKSSPKFELIITIKMYLDELVDELIKYYIQHPEDTYKRQWVKIDHPSGWSLYINPRDALGGVHGLIFCPCNMGTLLMSRIRIEIKNSAGDVFTDKMWKEQLTNNDDCHIYQLERVLRYLDK